MHEAVPVTPTLPRSERFVSPYLPVYAALGLAAGVWLGDRAHAAGWVTCAGGRLAPSPWWLLAPLPILLLVAVRGRAHRRVLIPVLFMVMMLAGVWRYLGHPFESCWGPNDLAYYNDNSSPGRPAVLEGMVDSYPDLQPGFSQYRVHVDTLWQGEDRLPVAGVLLVRAAADQRFQYGDRLRLRGVLATPNVYPDFDYRRYLARQGIHTIIRRLEIEWLAGDQGHPFWTALYVLRARASVLLNLLLPEPYAALANGMILGIDSGIPDELDADFKLTGTSHVLVISGTNIAVLSGFLLVVTRLLFRGRKGPATTLTLLCIVLYTLLVGAGPSVVRAAFMGALVVFGLYLGRSRSALISLFLAGLAMMLLNPLWLWDVGFQLSFMATLGLVLFAGPLQRRWQARMGDRLPRQISAILTEGLLLTVAAQMTTLPLIVLYFGRLSLISFVANSIILPVQPPILLAGMPAILGGYLYLPLGKLIALLPQGCLWWTTAVVQRLADVPYAAVDVGAFGRSLAMIYLVVLGAGFLWWLFRQEQQAPSLLPAGWGPPVRWGVALAMLAAVPVWMGATYGESQADGRLHLYLLGRDQAAAYLLVTPGGRRVLLDPCRETPNYPLDNILNQLPGVEPLDLVIRTRPGGELESSPPAGSVLEARNQALRPGARLNLGDNVTLTVLHAPANEHDSLLFLLRHRDFTTLLPFENNQETQAALAAQVPAGLALLPAPYPGTGAWLNPDLLAHLRPQVTLVPSGVTYPPGVAKILAAHTNLTSIPADAVVEVSSDGATFELRVQPYGAELVGIDR